jgi:hypothetical protein
VKGLFSRASAPEESSHFVLLFCCFVAFFRSLFSRARNSRRIDKALAAEGV